MSNETPVILVRRSGSVLTISLNRPDLHNAFNAELIRTLTTAIQDAESDEQVRVIVLEAVGRSFCAGADLEWMGAMVGYSTDENVADSLAMAGMYRALNGCTKPVVGRIHGAAIGGGVGLVACVDIAIASERAVFALSEVRLGLAPAVISPYVIARIGKSAARRYFLTGERFDAALALDLGLVGQVVPEEEIDGAVTDCVDALLQGAPRAQQVCKRLIQDVPELAIGAQDAHTAAVISDLRIGEEGQEGMRAFLEKREPGWVMPDEGDGE